MSDDATAGDRDARPASPAMPVLPALGPELDAARAQVVARGLTVNAFGQLTPLVTSLGLSLEALGPVKQLQKRFFSDAPWTRDDDEALADAIGPGVGGAVRHELEPGLTLVWGWEDGRFRLRVVSDAPAAPPNTRRTPRTASWANCSRVSWSRRRRPARARFASRLLRSTPGPAAPTPRPPRTPTRGLLGSSAPSTM